MKIALSSYSGYGAWFILRLLEEGHDVKYFLSEEEYADIMGGIIKKPTIISGKMSDYPDYSKFDVSVFDLTGREKQAAHSGAECPTLGDGFVNRLLEEDRMYGIQLMEAAEINVPPYESFTEVAAAKAYIKDTKKRFVYKPNGGQDQDAGTTYVSESAEDLLQYIDKLFAMSKGSPFILQEFIKGTEVSVEGWFNGEDFYLLNVTLEEKKFMNDGKGPNTGCSGNLVAIYNDFEPRIYREGLKKAAGILGSLGYRGMVDLNTIVTQDKVYGLEWTPRFGYDASAALIQCYSGNFGEMLYRIASGKIPEQSFKTEFCAGVRLTIPPYPTEFKSAKKWLRDVPIKGIEVEDALSTYMYDVKLDKGDLVCAGHSGFLAVPMGTGDTPEEAFMGMQEKVRHIDIPDCQYRTDIAKSTIKRYEQLKYQGWL